MAEEKSTLRFKLVLLGESAVGKSSVVTRFVSGQFSEQVSTVGACFMVQDVLLDGVTVGFDIWDTAGQERFATLAPMYYRGAHAAIVVYDITSLTSFHKARFWVSELQKKGPPNVVIALAGNKLDLQHMRQEAKNFADENGTLFFEISAKTSAGVEDLFMAIAKTMPSSSSLQPGPFAPGAISVTGQAGHYKDSDGHQTTPAEESGCC